jgi:hypothetical protein
MNIFVVRYALWGDGGQGILTGPQGEAMIFHDQESAEAAAEGMLPKKLSVGDPYYAWVLSVDLLKSTIIAVFSVRV